MQHDPSLLVKTRSLSLSVSQFRHLEFSHCFISQMALSIVKGLLREYVQSLFNEVGESSASVFHSVPLYLACEWTILFYFASIICYVWCAERILVILADGVLLLSLFLRLFILCFESLHRYSGSGVSIAKSECLITLHSRVFVLHQMQQSCSVMFGSVII